MICQCPQTITPTIKLLVDSGADVSFIKISSLKDEILVSEPLEQNLSGITGHSLHSLGTTTLSLQIGHEVRATEFQIAPSSFPVPYDGILGKPFIIGLETIVNYKTKQLILTDNPSNLNIAEQPESLVPSNLLGNTITSNIPETSVSENLQTIIQPRNETD